MGRSPKKKRTHWTQLVGIGVFHQWREIASGWYSACVGQVPRATRPPIRGGLMMYGVPNMKTDKVDVVQRRPAGQIEGWLQEPGDVEIELSKSG